MKFLKSLSLLAAASAIASMGSSHTYSSTPAGTADWRWVGTKSSKRRPADPVKKAKRKAQGKARAKSRKR